MEDDIDELDDQYLIRANDLIARAGEERPPIVEGMIPSNALILLAGQSQMAKSYLGLDLADCIASGEAWLGAYEVPMPGTVAYFSLENGLAAERTRLIKRGHTAEQSSDVFVSDDLDISDREGIKSMERSLRQYRPRLIVIDTARPALNNGAIIVPGKIREKIAPLRALAHRLNPAASIVLLVHNNQKNTLDGGPQWRANADMVIDIRAKQNLPNGDLRQHIEIAGRDGTTIKMTTDMDAATKRFRLAGTSEGDADGHEDRAAKLRERMAKYLPIAQALLRAGGAGTTVQIQDATGLTYKVVQILVREMRERGMIADSGDREGPRRNIIIYRLTQEMDIWTRQNGNPEQADYSEAAALFAEWGEE